MGNGTVQPALSPLLSCSPEQAGLTPRIPWAPGGRGFSWAGSQCGSSCFFPLSILRTTGEPAKGGGRGSLSTPIRFFL